MHPKDLSIEDFTYELPAERIANYPLPERDASKLLIYRNGEISEGTYRNLATHISSGSLLVFNNTRVIEARIHFRKATGGNIELFCLEPGEQYPGISHAMMETGTVDWHCLIGGASKWKPGQILEKRVRQNDGEIHLNASYIEKKSENFIIRFSWLPRDLSFAEILHAAGEIPLPPYIKRDPEPNDEKRYQTIYALPEGSVAAPTAGLHITDRMFKDLQEKNISTEFVTLHVGAGTFKPVKSLTLAGHDMHEEIIEVEKTSIEQIRQYLDASIVAVGTTSLRTLESLYWLGNRIHSGAFSREAIGTIPEIKQWEPYETKISVHPKDAIDALLAWMEQHQMARLVARTAILIAPGYTVRMAGAIITNFHQPNSTLLLLIAALVGEDWKKIYEYALDNEFRFLSYGDGSLMEIRNKVGKR